MRVTSVLRQLLAALAAVGLLYGGYSGLTALKQRRDEPAPSGPPPATPVAASPALRGPLGDSLEAIGTLRAARQVVIAPEVGGIVTAIHFESGDRIKAGAPLVQLNDAPERGDLERSRGLVAVAEQDLERARRLVGSGTISHASAEAAEGRYREVRGEMLRTAAVIAQKRLQAPFTGLLGVRRVDLGEYLQPGQPVVTLTDLDALQVDFSLPEQSLARLSVGLPLELTADAAPGRVFRAVVTAIEPQVDAGSRTALVRGTLDNRDHALRPGVFAFVRVVLPPEPDAITVPETALDRTIAGDTVFVVRASDRGRIAERVRVSAGRRVDGRVAILDGVAAGDLVVTSGQINLAPGAPVAVLDAPPVHDETATRSVAP